MAKEKETPKEVEAVYKAAEFIAVANIFGTQPECVEAALKLAGIQEATEATARKIVKEFLNKEVK